MRKNKSQAIIYYAALITFVVIALLLMANYITSRVQGSYKDAADKYGEGEQF